MTNGDAQAATEWRAAYERVVQLASDAGDQGMTVTVPATPDWTGRELLAHMVGVGVDAIAGEVPDDLNPTWTNGHLEARTGAGVEQLLSEWAAAASEIEAFIAETAPDPLGDVIIHEQDLRTALHRPGARDTPGLAAIRDAMIEKFSAAVSAQHAPGSLVLQSGDIDWRWASRPTSSGTGRAMSQETIVAAPAFDLFRAITSRRTADQLRGWTRSGSIEAFLPAFAQLGPLPDQAPPE